MTQQEPFNCLQCGNRTIAEVLGTASNFDWSRSSDEAEEPRSDSYSEYKVIKCLTCSTVQLFGLTDEARDGLDSAHLLYPSLGNISSEVPEAIAKEFWEARKVGSISRSAYAVLIGRVLERIFIDKGAQGDTLFDKLKYLSHKRIIPEPMIDIGHAIRYLRNRGAHIGEYQIDEDEVQAMNDLVATMLEYIYVAPSKLAQLKETMERKWRSSPKRPS